MAIPRLFKETNIFKKGAIANGIEDAGSKAENYIQDNSNGIFIHKLSDLLNGVRITDIIEIIRNNVSVAMFGTSVRIGPQTDANIQISADQTNGSVMSFNAGSNYVPVKLIGKDYVGFIEVDNSQIKIIGSHLSTIGSTNIDRLSLVSYGVNNQRRAAVVLDAYGVNGRSVVEASDGSIKLSSTKIIADGTLTDNNDNVFYPQRGGGFTTPTVASSAVTISAGGYVVEGKHVFVQIRCILSAALNADTARTIFTGMPMPRSVAEVALNVLARSRAGHACRITSDGEMQIIADPDHGISANQNITITGIYLTV